MTGPPRRPFVPTRSPGPGPLLAALRTLLARVETFGTIRADEHQVRWAARIHTRLEVVLREALDDPAARRALERVDERRRRTRKDR